MGKARKPKPPDNLSAEALDLWRRTLKDWPVGREQTLVTCLRSACLALDRLRQAEADLEQDGGGGLFRDRFGQPHVPPLMLVIRDSAKQVRDDLRALSLDMDVLNRRASADPDLEHEEV